MHGANPNARNEATRSALAVACLGTSSGAVRLLLETGADADGINSLEDEWIDGQHPHDTPLVVAVRGDNREVRPLTVCLMST